MADGLGRFGKTKLLTIFEMDETLCQKIIEIAS